MKEMSAAAEKGLKVKKKTTCQLFENLNKTFFSLKFIGGEVNERRRGGGGVGEGGGGESISEDPKAPDVERECGRL